MSISRLSAVERLPVELLALIFLAGASYEGPSPFMLKAEAGYNYEDTASIQAPIAVSQVCQRWRSVAVSTPRLWSALHFSHTSHIDRAKTFLSRTIPHVTPVDILIETVSPVDNDGIANLHVEEFEDIYTDILQELLSTWSSFHLKVASGDCKAFARKALSTCGPARKLRSLQLYHFEDFKVTEDLHEATYRKPVPVFDNDLPSLRHVSMVGVNLRWEESVFLSNLTSLELALHTNAVRPIWSTWRRILESSPHLRHLSLHYSGPRNPSDDLETHWPTVSDANECSNKVVLPNLRELSLSDLDPDYLHSLLLRLSLPALESLFIDLGDQDFTEVVQLLAKPVAVTVTNRASYFRTVPSIQIDPTAPSRSSASSTASPSHSPVSSIQSPPKPDDVTGTKAGGVALNPQNLKHLAVKALDCSLESWTDFVQKMTALKVLELDLVKNASSVGLLDCLGLGIGVGEAKQSVNAGAQIASGSHNINRPSTETQDATPDIPDEATHSSKWLGKQREIPCDHMSSQDDDRQILPSLEVVKVRVKGGTKQHSTARKGLKIVWEEEDECESDGEEMDYDSPADDDWDGEDQEAV